jgi:hypothetical protein
MLQGMALFFGETPQCNQIPAREDWFLDLDHSSREVPHPAMTILQTSVSTKGPQSTGYNPSGRVVGASFLLCAKTHCTFIFVHWSTFSRNTTAHTSVTSLLDWQCTALH